MGKCSTVGGRMQRPHRRWGEVASVARAAVMKPVRERVFLAICTRVHTPHTGTQPEEGREGERGREGRREGKREGRWEGGGRGR